MALSVSFVFFFNDTATTEIYTLSLHDALPIYVFELLGRDRLRPVRQRVLRVVVHFDNQPVGPRSEEHTSELQSLAYLVCRLLLEKKKRTLFILATASHHRRLSLVDVWIPQYVP